MVNLVFQVCENLQTILICFCRKESSLLGQSLLGICSEGKEAKQKGPKIFLFYLDIIPLPY